jgi:hypothetical protein
MPTKELAKQVGVVVVGVAIAVPLSNAADKGARWAFRKIANLFTKKAPAAAAAKAA